MNKDMLFVNGHLVAGEAAVLPAAEPGMMFGWGLFETIRVDRGFPFMLAAHIDRLFSSAVRIHIPLPGTKEALARAAMEYLQTINASTCALKIVLTKAGGKSANLLFTQRPLAYTAADYEKGFSVMVSPLKRNTSSSLVYMKTLNYLDNILAKQEAQAKGYQEAVFLNTDGFLAEGSVSNVFFVKDGKLYTPGLCCGLLPGIARKFVIDTLAPHAGLCVSQGCYTPEALFSADEAFLTNALMQIMPIARIGSIAYQSCQPGSITNTLLQAYTSFVQSGS